MNELIIVKKKLPISIQVFTIIIVLVFSYTHSYSQGCCSGGSGNPIAGGASQGVLAHKQIEIASNFQYLSSSKFKTEDRDTVKLFENFYSNYLYAKLGYGITKDLTLSVEAGYFLNKTQTGLYDAVLDKSEKIESSGISDLIIFPRYNVLSRSTEKKQVGLTLGLGYKIPLGSHTDSNLVYTNPTTGQQIYTTSPPIVQPTTGSHDLIAYAFFLRGFPQQNFKIFANTLYIRKGWNSLGEKFGDYSSVGLFAGKTFFKKLGVTLQLHGEMIGKLQAAKNVDLLAYYNVDTASTGSRKISLIPQISYTYQSFTVYALYDLPVYEFVYGAQIASQHQFTFGISYRFSTCRSVPPKEGETVYICPMRCEGGVSGTPGKCKMCGMDLVKEE